MAKKVMKKSCGGKVHKKAKGGRVKKYAEGGPAADWTKEQLKTWQQSEIASGGTGKVDSDIYNAIIRGENHILSDKNNQYYGAPSADEGYNWSKKMVTAGDYDTYDDYLQAEQAAVGSMNEAERIGYATFGGRTSQDSYLYQKRRQREGQERGTITFDDTMGPEPGGGNQPQPGSTNNPMPDPRSPTGNDSFTGGQPSGGGTPDQGGRTFTSTRKTPAVTVNPLTSAGTVRMFAGGGPVKRMMNGGCVKPSMMKSVHRKS